VSSLKNFLRKFPLAVKTVQKLRRIFSIFRERREILHSLNQLTDIVLQNQTNNLQQNHPNPLNRFGGKGFSQTDEDGITIEIVRRLGLEKGTYAEFGVGNGMENNTLILAAMGWKGFWVGGEDLAFSIKDSDKFAYLKSWITLENIVQLAKTGLSQVRGDAIDVVSLDLDGNDIYFVGQLLSNQIHPKLFIVEYNAQFPPPAKFQIDYDPNHIWSGDNYFGASLQNFYNLFLLHGYTLVCCNSHTGANAFFVKSSYEPLFDDVPKDISKIFVYPRYFLYKQYGHRQSPKVVETILRD